MTGSNTDVAVLGANGFIGGRLCSFLAESGLTVRLVARRPLAAPLGAQSHLLPPEPRPDDWITAVDGARCVINLVGLAHFGGSEESMAHRLFATNVATTATIARACAVASVERVVYLSSIKALAESSSRPLGSGDAGAPTTMYGGTKLAGELLTLAGVSETCQPTIVRIPMVYGVGARGNLARISRGVQRGMPFPRPSREGLRNLASLERLVRALHGLATTERPPERIHVCDPGPVVFSDIVRAVADGLGKRARLLPMPTAVLTTGLAAVGKRDVVQRWTQSLLVQGDGFEDYAPTSSRAGTLSELAAVAGTFT